MIAKQAQLSANDIYEKSFKNSMRGYNQEEVDEFLDIIIKDYDAFTKEIEDLQQEIEKLKRNTPEPSQTQHTRTRIAPQNTQVNYDVLKRLSNLEKAVFGKKIAETTE